MLRPTTAPGQWSILAAIAFGLLLAVFSLLVASGQRGGDEFFDNLWLAVPFVGAILAAVGALVFGGAAIVRSRERGIAVVAATALGLLVTAFAVAELLFPH